MYQGQRYPGPRQRREESLMKPPRLLGREVTLTHFSSASGRKKKKKEKSRAWIDNSSDAPLVVLLLCFVGCILFSAQEGKKKKKTGRRRHRTGRIAEALPPAKSPTAPHSLALNSGETTSACCHARIRRDDEEMLQFSSIRHR